MKYNPHDYQRYAAEFIIAHPVAALLLDMGLGKTSITLTAINDLLFDSFEIHKVLVVAPLRVARDTWSAEIEKWEHLKNLRYSVVVGPAQERLKALCTPADIYIINRENIQWLVEESGLTFDFDMAVIDELSSFKNHQSKRFKAFMKVRPKLKRIVGLTGTPASNGLMDLFAEFKLLDMGERLGRLIGQYRNAYFQPDKRNGMVVYSYKPLPDAEQRIYDKISDITISMKATDHLKMPELISAEYMVQLSENEKEKYDRLKKDLIFSTEDNEVTAANAASLSNKLSQMANGAVYSDDGETVHIHDRKLDALEDIIESMNGRPLLVAYWFKHDLERIKKRFEIREIKSSEDISDWNSGKIPVALIHPASAGHGLNLQSGGSTLVWFGLTWSLELYQQTNARLWRQGQTADTVVIQHIIAKSTIDEQIMKALKTKDTTQAALITAVKAEVHK
ncbi:DEAD/DEAH box helicase [[Eubacterium] siraeum]|uniref:DEAD/DEAH box helicase n=1 Tax=[Eubacterium] siraeum TaxID=39492 RepID=A0AAW6CYB3_9FIRM|nr:DEAD/DEAH box helicase [[Eubacterium] siraeum]MDB8003966.1 DEAD/DEAH box helicase [[Eubacterium] siraeum]